MSVSACDFLLDLLEQLLMPLKPSRKSRKPPGKLQEIPYVEIPPRTARSVCTLRLLFALSLTFCLPSQEIRVQGQDQRARVGTHPVDVPLRA